MFFGLFKKRIHEPIAAAVVLAAAFSLHSAWIVSLLVYRFPQVASALSLSPSIGPVSGMYAISFAAYAVAFGTATLWFQGKDVAHFRSSVFWFFIASLITFLVLTHPLVYTFEIQVPNV